MWTSFGNRIKEILIKTECLQTSFSSFPFPHPPVKVFSPPHCPASQRWTRFLPLHSQVEFSRRAFLIPVRLSLSFLRGAMHYPPGSRTSFPLLSIPPRCRVHLTVIAACAHTVHVIPAHGDSFFDFPFSTASTPGGRISPFPSNDSVKFSSPGPGQRKTGVFNGCLRSSLYRFLSNFAP